MEGVHDAPQASAQGADNCCPCKALSRHGYIGIEDEVVAAIAAWIKRK